MSASGGDAAHSWDERLGLPAFQAVRWAGTSEFYGAGSVAAEYCGVEQPAPIRGHWQHGWVAPHFAFHPAVVAHSARRLHRQDRYLVAREDQAALLIASGFPRARAIGLPIVYMSELPHRRIPGSLLVMPAHSSAATAHDWPFEEYAEAIAGIRGQFSEVLVCVHPSCWRNQYWVAEFEKRGLHVIEGARGDDQNALRRLQVLFSTFECVTTNGYGSVLVYAPYWGARVALFGPYAAHTQEALRRHPLYAHYPDLLDQGVDAFSEAVVRSRFPELWRHPAAAGDHREWARAQLGVGNRLAPSELQEALGWGRLRRTLWQARGRIPASVKVLVRRLRSPRG